MRRRLQSAAERSARSREKKTTQACSRTKRKLHCCMCVVFFLFKLTLHLNMNEGDKRQPKADKRNMKICYKHFPSSWWNAVQVKIKM